MKVFWSWQSDTHGKTGRHFIKGALVEALAELKEDPTIEDSERDEEGLHLDQDVQGAMGSPDLVNTILTKIDASAVFVADITSVGCVVDSDGKTTSKKLMNANVGIELGYALNGLSAAKVLLIFNEHYGTHEDMPFDLRHKGGAITFRLSPDADKASIASEMKSLKRRLVNALRPILQNSRIAALPEFQPADPSYCKAAYFECDEALAERKGEPEDDEDLYYVYDSPILFCLRLFPVHKLRSNLSSNELGVLARNVPSFDADIAYRSPIRDRNRFGSISFITASNPPRGKVRLGSSVQLFPSGEIWAISTQPAQLRAPELQPTARVPFVGSFAFEKLYINSVQKFVNFSATHLPTSGPWRLVCGVSGVKGHRLAVPGRHSDEMAGPFYQDDIEVSAVVKDNDIRGVNAVLLSFFDKVWDGAGANRPAAVNGFPDVNVRTAKQPT